MNTINIAWIIFAMLAIVVGLSFSIIYIRRQIVNHIQTHAHPEKARLRLLWVQFWVYVACAATYSVCVVILLTRGQNKAPAQEGFFALFFVWIFIRLILKIRSCQKESHKA
jgi:hypothetical protein